MRSRRRRSERRGSAVRRGPLSRLLVDRRRHLIALLDRLERLVAVTEEGAVLIKLNTGRLLESETPLTVQLLICSYLIGKACLKELGQADSEGATIEELMRVVAGVLPDLEEEEVMRQLGQLIRDGLVGYSARGVYVINYLRLDSVLEFLEGEPGSEDERSGEAQG